MGVITDQITLPSSDFDPRSSRLCPRPGWRRPTIPGGKAGGDDGLDEDQKVSPPVT
jgi:hypothetical protein